MNWRASVVAVMVLATFGGFAWLYYKGFVKKRAHGIILFVTDGLDLETLSEARLQTQVARSRAILTQVPPGQLLQTATEQSLLDDHIFEIEGFPYVGSLNVRGPGQPVPDLGAATTALASGQRVPNGRVGCNALNQQLPSLIYEAQAANRVTGLVTTSSLTAAPVVAFYGSMRSSQEAYDAATALVDYSPPDLVLGGGEQFFLPAHIANEFGRYDPRNLLEELKLRNYRVIRTRQELLNIPTWEPFKPKLFGVFADDQFAYNTTLIRNDRQPSLAEMTRVAIEYLQYNVGGYFLVIEHGLIGSASRQNLNQIALNEADAFDEAVRTAIAYAGPETLIVVVNSVSYGALTPATPLAQPLQVAGESHSSAALPVWLSGPGGPPDNASQREWFDRQVAHGVFVLNPTSPFQPGLAARFAIAASTTSDPAWLAARGFGARSFSGFYPNTHLYALLKEKIRQ